ncbi:hypothetical protein HAX54_029369 [Datura stramonium]|uniref:Uncharacterized protein n=1 Tax=Datura stramonium TaxID=4076 RepID=A0ABS8V6D5_DATST|nr:hypothetical protein [Datura stramonium]
MRLTDERSHLVTWLRRVLVNKDNLRKAIDPTLDPDEETYERRKSMSRLLRTLGSLREPRRRQWHRPPHEPSSNPSKMIVSIQQIADDRKAKIKILPLKEKDNAAYFWGNRSRKAHNSFG